MTAALGSVLLLVVCAVFVALIIRAQDKKNARASELAERAAIAKASAPMPTDLELLHDWMKDLAKQIDADAARRQIGFQWFLFTLPVLWGLTWGLLFAIVMVAIRWPCVVSTSRPRRDDGRQRPALPFLGTSSVLREYPIITFKVYSSLEG